MAPTRPLDTELLQRLDDRLRALGAQPIIGVSPGLSRAQIHDLTRHLTQPLPAEAELWWTWRTWGQGHILPGAQYLELDAAVAEYRSRRDWAATYGIKSVGSAQVSADDWWDPLWLPIFVVDSGIVLAIDVAQSDGSTVEVIQIDGQGFGTDSFAVTVAPSVGDFVGARLDAIDRGDFVYRRDIDLWLDASSA